ncbi:MAG: hypothetical protein M3Q44_07730 [bacterium]|nr:hypothetical protein [bacterium]
MKEFIPGFSIIKYVYHLMLTFGLTALFFGAVVSFNLFVIVILGIAIFALVADLYLLIHQKISINNSNLVYIKKSIFRDSSREINLDEVSSIKLFVRQGKYDLTERHSLVFNIAVNRDEPTLYIEKQQTLDLSLWSNSNIQETVNYLKTSFPSIIWS